MWGPCPVHGGDHPSGLRIELEGYSCPGWWVCYTRHCEEVYGKGPLGLIRGLLSSGGAPVKYQKCVDWALQFLRIRWGDLKPDETLKKIALTQWASYSPAEKGLSREIVRKHLSVPSQYFLSRNFSQDVLERNDVGDYNYVGRVLSERAVAPVYYKGKCVGFTGRSIHEKCPRCLHFHNPSAVCPRTEKEQVGAVKWRHHQLRSGDYLYGYDIALPVIRESGKVFLVEGPADVWRMQEAGFDNTLGLFGVHLSDRQQVLLELAGALHVVVLLDEDRAGEVGSSLIERKLGRLCKVTKIRLLKGDPGDYPPEELAKILL